MLYLNTFCTLPIYTYMHKGRQWYNGRAFASRLQGHWFEYHCLDTCIRVGNGTMVGHLLHNYKDVGSNSISQVHAQGWATVLWQGICCSIVRTLVRIQLPLPTQVMLENDQISYKEARKGKANCSQTNIRYDNCYFDGANLFASHVIGIQVGGSFVDQSHTYINHFTTPFLGR